VTTQPTSTPIEGTSAAPKRLEGETKEKVELNLQTVLGVVGVRWIASEGAYEIAYQGAYSEIESLRKAVISEGVACEVVSPLEITFRPRAAVRDPKPLTTALGTIAGVHLVLQQGADFKVYASVDLELELLNRAASKVGVTGEIVSHEVLELRLKDFSLPKRDAAKAELRGLAYVLRFDVDSKRLQAMCVKGRVKVDELRALLERHGFTALP